MKQFEYRFESFRSGGRPEALFSEDIFAHLGLQGWEYCGHEWGLQIFKREIEHPKQEDV